MAYSKSVGYIGGPANKKIMFSQLLYTHLDNMLKALMDSNRDDRFDTFVMGIMLLDSLMKPYQTEYFATQLHEVNNHAQRTLYEIKNRSPRHAANSAGSINFVRFKGIFDKMMELIAAMGFYPEISKEDSEAEGIYQD